MKTDCGQYPCSCSSESVLFMSTCMYNDLSFRDTNLQKKGIFVCRGKCKVVHCNSLEAARTFRPAADTFYCILGYNPETKRLATTQGQIRVGSMYQVNTLSNITIPSDCWEGIRQIIHVSVLYVRLCKLCCFHDNLV